MARFPKHLTMMKTSLKKPTPERHQGGRVAVGSKAQMDEVKHRRHAGNLLERQGVPLGCSF
jgi:hypothetical protein